MPIGVQLMTMAPGTGVPQATRLTAESLDEGRWRTLGDALPRGSPDSDRARQAPRRRFPRPRAREGAASEGKRSEGSVGEGVGVGRVAEHGPGIEGERCSPSPRRHCSGETIGQTSRSRLERHRDVQTLPIAASKTLNGFLEHPLIGPDQCVLAVEAGDVEHDALDLGRSRVVDRITEQRQAVVGHRDDGAPPGIMGGRRPPAPGRRWRCALRWSRRRRGAPRCRRGRRRRTDVVSGAATASREARPGAEIGVGGNPATR